MTHAVINGEYVTFKHVKTRKVVVLEIEVAEELFQDVITKLGMPIGGESKPVAVCLLQKHTDIHTPDTPIFTPPENSEGKSMRTRAVMVCKDKEFQDFAYEILLYQGDILEKGEEHSRVTLITWCNIKSRSELATSKGAQGDFLELMTKFDLWKLDNRYKDNLSR